MEQIALASARWSERLGFRYGNNLVLANCLSRRLVLSEFLYLCSTIINWISWYTDWELLLHVAN